MKKIHLLILIGAGFALGFLVPLPAAADSENHNFSISHDFQVSGGTVDVSHTVEVENKTRVPLETVELALPVTTTEGLSAAYGDGTSISTSTVSKSADINGVEFDYTGLVLDFPREVEGTNESWSFEVEYETSEGLNAIGDSRVLLLPFLDGRLDASWSADVTVPGSWPQINYGPAVSGIDAGNNTRLSFNGQDYSNSLLALSFSEDTVHEVTIQEQLRNRSLWPRTIPVVLPLDLHNQTVSLQELSPEPTSMEVDRDGNIVAYYRLWPQQTTSVTAKLTAHVQQLRYDPGEAENIDRTPDTLADYTTRGRYWNTQGQAGDQAISLIDPQEDAWSNTRQIFDFIQSEINYDSEATDRVEADEVLSGGSGNAENIADLLTAMLRSQSIPARMVYGAVYPSAGVSDGSIGQHVWVEAYIPGTGWVQLDPVWSRLFESHGYSSSDRVGLLAVSQDGQLNLAEKHLRLPQLAPSEAELAEADPEADIEFAATQYVIVPGVMVEVVSARNSGARVVDGVAIGGRQFGSMAPVQKLSAWSWSFGSWEARQLPAEAGGIEREITTGVQWWPVVFWGVMAAGVVVLQFYRRKHRKYLRQRLQRHY